MKEIQAPSYAIGYTLRRLVMPASLFSIAYASIEYYLIRDTTFGHNPVLFSLIYPYHLAMAVVFGLAACCLLVVYGNIARGILSNLVLTGTLFSSMLVIEDFAWFTFRAIAPAHEDTNAGRLVMQGEWTTQFMGSTNAYFTEIPNWYFLSAAFAASSILTLCYTGSRQ